MSSSKEHQFVTFKSASFIGRGFCYTCRMKAIIGIDEVGRGPIAGPVAVCAYMAKKQIKMPLQKNGEKLKLRDSKKLSRERREEWFAHMEEWKAEGVCDFHVCMVSAREIDKNGIAPAIRKAVAVCLEKINADPKTLILLDGGLKAPAQFKSQETIIKGDESEPVISLASIAAKVTRDRYMFKQAKKYPKYGFENHVGYGTKEHYKAIKKHGLTPLHRKSFLKGLDS